MTVVALVGAQFGSEGKGAIAAKLANDFEVHVRTGAPNAGHTYFIDCPHPSDEQEEVNNDGQGHIEWGCSRCRTIPFPYRPEREEQGRAKLVARSIPVGVSNKNASLVIGPGGMLDVELLLEELQELDSLGLDASSRLYVDRRALIIDKTRHHDYEGGIRGRAHEAIGSTGEGVGIARMAHLARGVLARDAAWGKLDHAGNDPMRGFLSSHGVRVIDDAPRAMNMWIETGSKVLLEGTQGSGLSSVYGPWPYCTSTDTNAGQMCVDAGISPLRLSSTILVARTFPIRVAGQSGPLFNEITWDDLGVEPETTTVTKKVRRVGMWDDEQFASALRLNGPKTLIAVTFMDYIDPLVAGVKEWGDLTPTAISWIHELEYKHDCRVAFVGTGPDSVAVNSTLSNLGKR